MIKSRTLAILMLAIMIIMPVSACSGIGNSSIGSEVVSDSEMMKQSTLNIDIMTPYGCYPEEVIITTGKVFYAILNSRQVRTPGAMLFWILLRKN